MSSEDNEYLLGTDAAEVARLQYQHQVWSQQTACMLDQSGIKAGDSVLDLGAGPGFTTLALAERVGQSGSVTAIDTSNRFAKLLVRRLADAGFDRVAFQLGDVHELDMPHQAYDGVLARWLFCFLKDPEAVIARVAQWLKPGASFTALDYFNYLGVAFQPNSPALKRGFEAVEASFRASGGDLYIGDRLPVMLERNGFRITNITPICEISRPGDQYWRWFESFKANFFPKLEAAGYLSPAQHEAFSHDLEGLANQAGSFFFTPPMLTVTAVKV